MQWTPEEVNTYLKIVRDDLAEGRITAKQLKMDEVIARCGTVACIGGWMKLRRREAEPQYTPSSMFAFTLHEITHTAPYGALDELFYGFPQGDVTPERAVRAIDQCLNGHADPWELKA